MDQVSDAMKVLLPTNAVQRVPKVGCTEISMYSKRWPLLIPQHGAGRKHLRLIELERWQEHVVLGAHADAFVCGLVHSDGCRCINKVTVRGRRYEYPRYMFSNRSEDIHDIFRRSLRALSVRTTRSGWNQSVSRKDDVAVLDAIGAAKDSPWLIDEPFECPGRDSNPHDREVNGF